MPQITTGTLMGQVKINGDVMPVTRLRKIMGFVPQVCACMRVCASVVGLAVGLAYLAAQPTTDRHSL